MTKLVIEATTRTATNSMGFEAVIPVVNLIYFEQDEDTGARYVDEMFQLDVEPMDPAHTVLNLIAWGKKFRTIEVIAGPNHDLIVTIKHTKQKNLLRAMQLTHCYISMIKADYLGYKDDNGSINKETGINIFEAYLKDGPDFGTFDPYIDAGRGRL